MRKMDNLGICEHHLRSVVSVCRKARCQPFCSLCGNGHMLEGDGVGVRQ